MVATAWFIFEQCQRYLDTTSPLQRRWLTCSTICDLLQVLVASRLVHLMQTVLHYAFDNQQLKHTAPVSTGQSRVGLRMSTY